VCDMSTLTRTSGHIFLKTRPEGQGTLTGGCVIEPCLQYVSIRVKDENGDCDRFGDKTSLGLA
jgi:hypothetical protein